jgi:hypothetical protein
MKRYYLDGICPCIGSRAQQPLPNRTKVGFPGAACVARRAAGVLRFGGVDKHTWRHTHTKTRARCTQHTLQIPEQIGFIFFYYICIYIRWTSQTSGHTQTYPTRCGHIHIYTHNYYYNTECRVLKKFLYRSSNVRKTNTNENPKKKGKK